jgi:hypothetical protein
LVERSARARVPLGDGAALVEFLLARPIPISSLAIPLRMYSLSGTSVKPFAWCARQLGDLSR